MKNNIFLFLAASSALLFAQPCIAQTTTNDDVLINGDNGTVNLKVTGNNGALFGGTFESGAIPGTGDGVRMMWYPKKAAFRAGYAYDDWWDDANIGEYSTSLGAGKASGEYSFAVGGQAIGPNSIALNGYAEPFASFSGGFACYVLGTSTGSVALGMETIINNSAGSFGFSCTTSRANIQNSPYSYVLGAGWLAYSTAISIGGDEYLDGTNMSYAGYCIGIGYSNEINSTGRVTVLGSNLIGHDFGSTILGGYNFEDYAGSNGSFAGEDKLLVVGNGSYDEIEIRSNALELRKNADMRVGGRGDYKGGLRAAPLGDISMGAFTAGDNPATLDLGLEYDGE